MNTALHGLSGSWKCVKNRLLSANVGLLGVLKSINLHTYSSDNALTLIVINSLQHRIYSPFILIGECYQRAALNWGSRK